MSMTREEAIEIFEQKGWWIAQKETLTSKQAEEIIKLNNAVNFALSALRPISRERIEEVWRGECDCSKPKACCTCCSMRCQYCIGQSEYRQATFCMKCGRPMTDEAVEMVMERLEGVNNG